MLNMVFENVCSPKLQKIKLMDSTEMDSEEALKHLIDTNLTKEMYIKIRQKALKHNHNLYPPYANVKKFFLFHY